MLERGVRFVQLFNGSYAMGEGVGNWDGHKTLVAIQHPRSDSRSTARRCARPETTRHARRHARRVRREFGRMPTFQRVRAAAITIHGLPSGSRVPA
ncbi:MAG: hypothetical protein U0744_02945 [Gemmataceae bacterium]